MAALHVLDACHCLFLLTFLTLALLDLLLAKCCLQEDLALTKVDGVLFGPDTWHRFAPVSSSNLLRNMFLNSFLNLFLTLFFFLNFLKPPGEGACNEALLLPMQSHIASSCCFQSSPARGPNSLAFSLSPSLGRSLQFYFRSLLAQSKQAWLPHRISGSIDSTGSTSSSESYESSDSQVDQCWSQALVEPIQQIGLSDQAILLFRLMSLENVFSSRFIMN